MRRAGNYHRTYLYALMSAEFVLESIAEPVAAPLLAERRSLYREVPIFFAVRAGTR